MKRIRSTNDRLVDLIVFDPKKNIKLQPVTPFMPLEALLIPVNLTDSDSDGINGGTGCNFIFFTVPTTCSRPSIEMVGFIYLLLCRLLVVGPVLKWLALFITVPTTCSRPSIEMVGFIYVCMYVCISPCSLP